MKKGTIIILNGVSCSGKSSLALALQKTLSEAYLTFGKDEFCWNLAKGLNVANDKAAFDRAATTLFPAFHKTIGVLAENGNNIIVDLIIKAPEHLQEIIKHTADLDTYFIGVMCSIEELERRESERPNRPEGNARSQLAAAHAHKVYDLEVDTTNASSEACAQLIRKHIENNPPTAFKQLEAKI